jgi:hypothetical protein
VKFSLFFMKAKPRIMTKSVDGIRYECKGSIATAVSERSQRSPRRDAFVRGFLSFRGRRIIVKCVRQRRWFNEENMRDLGSHAKWKRVMIPKEMEILRTRCLSDLDEVYFEFGSALKEFGYEAFTESPLRFIRIPSNVETIMGQCFARDRYRHDPSNQDSWRQFANSLVSPPAV